MPEKPSPSKPTPAQSKPANPKPVAGTQDVKPKMVAPVVRTHPHVGHDRIWKVMKM